MMGIGFFSCPGLSAEAKTGGSVKEIKYINTSLLLLFEPLPTSTVSFRCKTGNDSILLVLVQIRLLPIQLATTEGWINVLRMCVPEQCK